MPSGTQRRPIRVVIVDDPAPVREGSVQLLAAEPDLEVVGQAGTDEDGLELIERTEPDVALVDINLPAVSGRDLAREVADRQHATRVLVFSAYDGYAYVTRAIGVGGCLLKTASAQEVVGALRLVADGVPVLDRAVSTGLRRTWQSESTHVLAKRGAASMTQAAAHALRHHLVPLGSDVGANQRG